MFGSQPKVKKPVLMLVVLGVLLVIVGVTATAQAVMVSAYATTSTLSAAVDADVATVRGFVHQQLADLDPGRSDAASQRRLDAALDGIVAKGGIARAEVRTPDGRVIASSLAGGAGASYPTGSDFAAAVGGEPKVALLSANEAETELAGLPSSVLRAYIPLRQGDRTQFVVGIWRDAVPMLSGLDGLRRDVVIVTLSAALIAAVVLFLVFRTAQSTIQRQTAALVDATRLDPLTGSLNHGALVAHLATEIEQARGATGAIGVALVDIDNFRLLNDTHGHLAGDDVLRDVAGAIGTDLPTGAVMGRYGPDEFLIVTSQHSLAELQPAVERMRANLTGMSLEFEGTERLPVSVSAGICAFPEHGASVTELLSTAAATVGEARASGGDTVVVASVTEGVTEQSIASFGVLQGLVFAIDTKDRYTKRHSADVARYGAFLAEQLGLEPATVDAIHAAGLLHDVGKIGIPIEILRKPARLTAAEYDVVKQHVALGDMIVRGLPDIDAVRAGVRHHHERWDGKGYLEALRGEEIPLVARILAVGDAFSAMTTTRPYRKALDVREAMRRLEDAAGTQLDEKLVAAFIRGLETVEDAPLPGAEASSALWRPARSVA